MSFAEGETEGEREGVPSPLFLSLVRSTTYRPARHEEHERRRFEISPFSAEAMEGRALRINNHMSGATDPRSRPILDGA